MDGGVGRAKRMGERENERKREREREQGRERGAAPTSLFIPSTTIDMEPSLPRRALPLPQTETNVINETTKMLAQMQIVEKRCSRPFASGLKCRACKCTDISRKAIEKPASRAACVATAEKLLLNKLSSFSRSLAVVVVVEEEARDTEHNSAKKVVRAKPQCEAVTRKDRGSDARGLRVIYSIVRCLILERSSSLSAASMVLWLCVLQERRRASASAKKKIY